MIDMAGMSTDTLAERLDVKIVNLQSETLTKTRKADVAPEAIHIAFELRQRGDLDEGKFKSIVKVCNEYIPTSGTR